MNYRPRSLHRPFGVGIRLTAESFLFIYLYIYSFRGMGEANMNLKQKNKMNKILLFFLLFKKNEPSKKCLGK